MERNFVVERSYWWASDGKEKRWKEKTEKEVGLDLTVGGGLVPSCSTAGGIVPAALRVFNFLANI